jgi:hypothetical protein
MRHSDASVYFLFLLYMGSIGFAFLGAHSFVVLGFGEILFGVVLLTGPLFVAFDFVKGSERSVIVAAHIALAIFFHPEVTFKDPLYLNTSEQFELLRELNAKSHSWWVKADMSYDLASALKTNATLRFKISSPFWYWAFPPSVVLIFWGVVFFFRYPKTERE